VKAAGTSWAGPEKVAENCLTAGLKKLGTLADECNGDKAILRQLRAGYVRGKRQTFTML